jgi:hypothetical protein
VQVETVAWVLGNLALQQVRFDLARDYFMRAETRWVNDPEIAYRLACVASLSGRTAEALVWLEKALR